MNFYHVSPFPSEFSYKKSCTWEWKGIRRTTCRENRALVCPKTTCHSLFHTTMSDMLNFLWGNSDQTAAQSPPSTSTIPSYARAPADAHVPSSRASTNSIPPQRVSASAPVLDKPERTRVLKSDLSDSVLLETEKFTPYRNLLVFLSTVLLWHRPIPFGGLCVVTHLFLWYTAKALLKWKFAYLLGTVLLISFCVDFICRTQNITWDRILGMFPDESNEKVSYYEIMQQYVVAKKWVAAQRDHMLQFRQEQPVQFLISGLFFTIVFCFLLSFFNLFFVVYCSVFALLLTPGIWHHNALHRSFHHLAPLVAELYSQGNEKITDFLEQRERGDSPAEQRPSPTLAPVASSSTRPPIRSPITTRDRASTTSTRSPLVSHRSQMFERPPTRPSQVHRPSVGDVHATIPPTSSYYSASGETRKRYQ